LAALGFGFLEVGTVTPRPQPGNPAPRLFRFPGARALVNRMGFNNAGADALRDRLVRKPAVPLGVNIGKNKDTPNERAADDYAACLERLYDRADFFVVNVSSPNTPGLRAK
jgi:dihydroorotate dehydrogenase